MCATVIVEDIDPAAPVWDRDRVAILIGPGLDYFEALKQVRALLTFLGAHQTGLGATCWCGDFVAVPKQLPGMPRQQTIQCREEAHHAR